ncbi:MAG: hypothetical protein KatS3mg060_1159 [Dehalococcoidia bacterium]|nr:MAG: hypothetical protein KatS3mg060_1159 [Dehalococcoidia bacterium]
MGYFVTERLLRYEPPPRRLHVMTTGTNLDLSGQLVLRRTTTPANQRVWRVGVDSDSALRLYAVSDDGASANAALEIARNGAQPAGVIARSSVVDQPLAVNVANTTLGAYVGFRRSGQTRWTFGVNADSESGSNEGSNFAINSYADNGSYLATPISINRRWNVISANGEFYVNRTGGDLANLNATQSGQTGNLVFRRNSVKRWALSMSSATEGGGNIGSDLHIDRYNNSGDWLSTPMSIWRDSGTVQFRHPVLLDSGDWSSADLVFNSPTASNERWLIWRRMGTNRWALLATNAAETGSNSGTHFEIRAYADNGAWLHTPLRISRRNGVVTVTGQARGLVHVPNNTWTNIWQPTANVTMGIIMMGLIGNPGINGDFGYSAFCLWHRGPDGTMGVQIVWKGTGCNVDAASGWIRYIQGSGGTQGVHYAVYELFRWEE